MRKSLDQEDFNPSGMVFTMKQMYVLFNYPLSLLRDSTNMDGHEEWCHKMGEGKTSPWLFDYDAFKANYNEIRSRRLRKLD